LRVLRVSPMYERMHPTGRCRRQTSARQTHNPPWLHRNPRLWQSPRQGGSKSSTSRSGAMGLNSCHVRGQAEKPRVFEHRSTSGLAFRSKPISPAKKILSLLLASNPVLQRKTPLDVLKRFAALTRQPVAPAPSSRQQQPPRPRNSLLAHNHRQQRFRVLPKTPKPH